MLNGVTCQGVGYHGGYNSNPQRNVQSVLQNGYLYMVSYDKTKVYKINIENAADIKEIPLDSASAYSCNDDYYRSGSIYLANLGDWVVGSDFRINTEEKCFVLLHAEALTEPASKKEVRLQWKTLTVFYNKISVLLIIRNNTLFRGMQHIPSNTQDHMDRL